MRTSRLFYAQVRLVPPPSRSVVKLSGWVGLEGNDEVHLRFLPVKTRITREPNGSGVGGEVNGRKAQKACRNRGRPFCF